MITELSIQSYNSLPQDTFCFDRITRCSLYLHLVAAERTSAERRSLFDLILWAIAYLNIRNQLCSMHSSRARTSARDFFSAASKKLKGFVYHSLQSRINHELSLFSYHAIKKVGIATSLKEVMRYKILVCFVQTRHCGQRPIRTWSGEKHRYHFLSILIFKVAGIHPLHGDCPKRVKEIVQKNQHDFRYTVILKV